MNKKTAFKILTVILSLAMCVTVFVACNDPQDSTAPTKYYDIPSDLTVSVGIYNGETLLGTITNGTLAKVSQEKITMSTTNKEGTPTTVVYVAYSLKTLLAKANITAPAFTAVLPVSPDGFFKNNIEISNFDKSYITIGTVENGAFVSDDDSPRFIADKSSSSSKHIWKDTAKIIVNPIAA